jgi:DUF3102 family protein
MMIMRSKSRRARTVAQADAVLARYAKQIHTLARRTTGDIVKIGELLVKAKARCGHGGWLSWLHHEFGWSEDTARRFMQVRELVGKNRKLRNLGATVLYLLAKPSTPTEVRDAIIMRVDAGEMVTAHEVQMDFAKASRSATVVETMTEDMAVEWLARQTRRHFCETIASLQKFREHRVLDNPEMAADVLKTQVSRDDRERLREALDFIEAAFPKLAVVVPLKSLPQKPPDPAA